MVPLAGSRRHTFPDAGRGYEHWLMVREGAGREDSFVYLFWQGFWLYMYFKLVNTFSTFKPCRLVALFWNMGMYMCNSNLHSPETNLFHWCMYIYVSHAFILSSLCCTRVLKKKKNKRFINHTSGLLIKTGCYRDIIEKESEFTQNHKSYVSFDRLIV